MPSTFSQSLRLELIGSGEQSGVWGVTTNNNLGDLLEQAITGNTTVNVTGGNVTLTALNGVVDQSRSAVLFVTGTPGTTRIITIPNVGKSYTVKNTSDSPVQIKTSGGLAFEVPRNAESYIYCDGSNNITGRIITDGANTILSQALPFNNPAFTGVPTAPTAPLGTNTTQVATTAFVNAEIASDTANLAPLNSPALTGTPTAPTAALGTNTTQIATTAFVNAEIAADTANLAPLNSPALTGTPTAPTAAVTINNTQIATTAFVRSIIPAGVITMWSGSIASIPAGWALCDGSNGTPDLRDRFVVSAGSTYAVGATGGANSVTLLTANLPSHTHSISGSGTTSGQSSDHTHTYSNTTSGVGDHVHGFGVEMMFQAAGSGPFFTGNQANIQYGISTQTAGAGAHSHSFSGVTAGTNSDHTHTFSFSGTSGATGSATAIDIRPLYYALAYIMKT